LASFGRGAALHGETSEAGNNELTTLLELEGADAGHRGEGSLSFLAAETSLDAEVVHKLALGQVGALGLDGGQRSLALGSGLLHGLGHYGMLIELLS